MNFRPVHQNLDTSFVNLSALIKYLRRRQFAGIVRVRLNNYEAEIHITDENQMNVREQDHLSGRVSEGEEALQRILIRSREPGGTVNVFQKVNGKFAEEVRENKDVNKPLKVSAKPVIIEQKPSPAIVTETKSVAETAIKTPPVNQVRPAQTDLPKIEPQVQKTEVSLPDFPFRLSNNVEAKAKQTKITTEQFQTLVKIFAELLGTIDKSLASAKLNFPAAFAKACSEISNDYPFLKPEENIFRYDKGEIKISGQINANQFSSCLLEAIRRVLEKLGANPKFSETYRATVQNLLALIRRRKPLYDEFSITSKLEKIIGA
ncbi:hypothetical protein BH20ACI4_BH20ACI4_11590 [soil metagenome]